MDITLTDPSKIDTTFNIRDDHVVVTAAIAGGEPVATVTLKPADARRWAAALLQLADKIDGQEELPSARMKKLRTRSGLYDHIESIIEYLDERWKIERGLS